ncbi:hypothetical protein ACFRCQ_25305 [Cytobacillus firmus]|uniref:hypothetical protein n=1 Tax=Cytobacillus firmus TaxID=1399 RepID=UPI0036B87229
MNQNKSKLEITSTTRKLQLAIALSSVIFTIGTTLQNFVIVNTGLIETMMQMAGAQNPAGEAPGFTFWFRIVGCIYILGNALGLLAFRSRSRVLWWTILSVNITQGLGFAMIPPSMWTASTEAYGVWGILPSVITDGGGLILSLVMIISMVKYRTTWAQHRLHQR